MNRSTRNVLKYLVSGLLTLVLLYVSFRGADLDALTDSLLGADYRWLFLMFVLLMGSHVIRAIRWGYLLAPMKPGIRFRSLFSGLMVGYCVNNILPRAGELVRPYVLGRREGLSVSSAVGTIVVERMIDALSFLVLLGLFPLVYDGPLKETFPWLEQAGMVLAVVIGIALSIIMVFVFRRDMTTRVIGWCSSLLPKRWHGRFHQLVHSFLDGFLIFRDPRSLVVMIVLSVGIWFFYIAMIRAAFYAFDLEHIVGWRAAIVVLAISSIGIAVPTPGSTGGYHFFTSRTLTGLFFVPGEVALGFATATHAVGFIGTTVIGLYFLMKDHIRLSDVVRSGDGVAP